MNNNYSVKLVILVVVYLAIGSLCTVVPQSTTCKPVDFRLPQRFEGGPKSTSINTANINGDNIPDLVLGDSVSRTVSVLLGAGAGAFGPPQSFAASVDVDSVAVGDLNGDGKPDVVVGSKTNGNQVVILWGDSNEGFGAPQLIATTTGLQGIYDLKTGDFNGDGKTDIVAAAASSVIFLLSNGQGSFSLSPMVTLPGFYATLAVGDLDNDNLDDVAIARTDSTSFAIIRGNSSAAFSVSGTFPLEAGATGIAFGSFNGDNLRDIVVVGNYITEQGTPKASYVQPWIGTGGLNFTAGARIGTPQNSRNIVVTDFDKDGVQDLAVNSSSFVTQLLGLGNGGFAAPVSWMSNGSVAIAAVDTNQDNRDDIAALRYGSDAVNNISSGPSIVSVILTNSQGTLEAQRPVLDGGTHIVAADMNSDNFTDLITTRSQYSEPSGTPTRVVLAMNDHSEGFLPEVWAGASPSLFSFVLANINNDGKPDFLTGHSGNVNGYLGNGAGGLIPLAATVIGVQNAIHQMAVGDFNGDGKEDLMIVNSLGVGEEGRIFLGNGNGTYQNLNYSIGYVNSFFPTQVGDFNKDGKLDLVTVSLQQVGIQFESRGLQTFLGNGDGRFTSGAIFPTAGFESIAKGDFNGDGNLDIAGVSGQMISKFFGDGNGGFSSKVTTSIPGNARSIIAADFNSDSLDDVAFVLYDTAGTVGVVPSTSEAPFFGTAAYYPVGGLAVVYPERAYALAAADYNNDGRIDIGYTENFVSRGVIYNTSSASTPCMSIDDVTVTETDAGQNATFTVSLSQPSTKTVAFNYAVRDRTATVGADLQNRYGRQEIPAGQISAIITVPIEGDLSDEFDEEFLVKLSGVANAFLVKDSAVGKIIDNDAEPSFGISDVELTEVAAAQQAVININLSAPSGKPISFRYSTANGTAISGGDYAGVSTIKTIPAGTVSTTIGIQIFTDTMHELTEDFFVNLSEPTNVMLTNTQAKITIFDNDPVPTFTISAGSINEPDTGFVNRSVTIRLSNPTYLTVTGNTQSSDGTARAGVDYEAFSAPFAFAPGITQLVAQVRVLGDRVAEQNETFFINATDLQNANVGSSQAQITIIDDESTPFDFDGDGKADMAVRRPTDNVWYFLRTTAGYTGFEYGVVGDLMAPADFDGDGKMDVAIFRPSEGQWYIAGSTVGFYTVNWGAAGDMPVPTDYDGDGKADIAVYRPANGTWYRKLSNGNQISILQFGTAEDKPQMGDFDGDGKADLVVSRPSNNTWYFLRTSTGFTAQEWGAAGDINAPADFDGDGKTDLAVFRPSTGVWFIAGSSSGFSTKNWGADGDVPVAADYDGDGKTDAAVFRPSNNAWYLLQTTNGIAQYQFGAAGDKAIPSSFVY